MNDFRRVSCCTVVIFLFIAFLAPDSALALRSTKEKGYTDPDYIGYAPKSIVLLVLADDLEVREAVEKKLVKDLGKQGITVHLQYDLFPPTRDWPVEQQQAVYERESIEAGIIFTVGASSTSLIPFATQTYSSGNVFGSYNGNSGFNAYDSGTSTSAIFSYKKSKGVFSAVLMDLSENRVAWYSDISTKAGGLLFAGTTKDAKAAAGAVTKSLKKHGHLLKK